jgi:hypothetical protein
MEAPSPAAADHLGGEKGERDGHVDTTDTASLTQRSLLSISEDVNGLPFWWKTPGTRAQTVRSAKGRRKAASLSLFGLMRKVRGC